MVNSINTNIAAYYAQANINLASQSAATSVARLSSGNRITRAADDVAALATGTSLRTQVNTLKTALTNASQGSTLLQIADGALSQITDILQRQKAIALQSSSGSLQNSDRVFLNQEFTALTAEINRLTASTTFNGVQLINGSLSDTVGISDNTSIADAATIQINFSAIPTDGELVLNGVTIVFDATPDAAGDVQRGGTIAESLQNLVAYLNGLNNAGPSGTYDNGSIAPSSAADIAKLTGVTYSANGTILTISSLSGGALSEFYTVDSALINGSGSEVTGTVSGKGAEVLTVTDALDLASIDADASTSEFDGGSGVLTFNNGAVVTIYTVQSGDSLRDIVNGINANSGDTGVTAFITGTSGAYKLNLRSAAGSGAVTGTGLGSVTTTTGTVSSLTGGGVTGIGQGSTIGVGTVGNGILTAQNQQFAQSVISFPSSLDPDDLLNKTIIIEGVTFTFTATAQSSAAQTEILIDASTDGTALQKTLDNAVAAINAFTGAGTSNYAFDQIEAAHEGSTIVIRSKQAGNALDMSAGTLTITGPSGVGGVSTSATTMSGTSNTGIDTTGINNAAFVGNISGFNAVYVSANTVNLSITIGGILYSVNNVNTNPSSDTDVRLISENGGYFTMKLAANKGIAVSGSSSANDFAKALDAAVSPLTFYQRRDVNSYTTSGNLIGSSVVAQLDDFTDINLSGITVTAPSGSNPNGSISFSVNGETYTALLGIGTQLGAYSITRFVSESDANKYIEFRNGANVLSFATSDDAADLQDALRQAFGVGEGAKALSFQVGNSSNDILEVSIGNATTANLFGGVSLNVLSQASAAVASSTLEDALATVTSLRANVGALQSRFNFASVAIQSSIQNQDAARGELLDTDIATESTAYATAQVKLQAGISVLAQANQQLQSLLKLIG